MTNIYGDGMAWVRRELIGRGSSGSVYLATLKKSYSRTSCLPPAMAVKSAEVSFSGSVQKEREILCNVQGSPYVIGCLGEETTIGKNGRMVYNLLLEYGSGGTLAGLIDNSGGKGLPEWKVRHFTWSILRGLNHVHGCGYVHRDLNPDNILLVADDDCADGFVLKICDFGLARRFNKSQSIMKANNLEGTLMYLSPEAVTRGVQGPRSDVWALGCVVIEMLTGKFAWDWNSESGEEGLIKRIRYESPEIPDEISDTAKDFLKGCFVRNVKCRYTAEMLLDHPFVKGFADDDDDDLKDELGETKAFDSNEIRSSADAESCTYYSEGKKEKYSVLLEGDLTFDSQKRKCVGSSSTNSRFDHSIKKQKLVSELHIPSKTTQLSTILPAGVQHAF